jgi:hypothetical protein
VWLGGDSPRSSSEEVPSPRGTSTRVTDRRRDSKLEEDLRGEPPAEVLNDTLEDVPEKLFGEEDAREEEEEEDDDDDDDDDDESARAEVEEPCTEE